ncbi:MAG TPA: recombinase family protein [Gemmatimonadaceae bacterium]|nr:recombinase family protein [Gemmatimonadaceae bacterium]
MIQAAIYARKSTAQDDIEDDAKSVARQVAGARKFIAAKSWLIEEAHVYTDDGVSGALFARRPEFQRMMRDAAAGVFEAVVFYDLDRFGRHGHQTMVALNALADLGVTVWDFSTGKAVDLDTFAGRITTTLHAEFAQQYREDIRKKTREAMHYKAAQGYVTGSKVFGYDNVRIGKGHVERRINDGEATVVRDIYERFAEGSGARSIAGALNRAGVPSPRAQQGRPPGWSSSTVRAVLERPLYRGLVVYGRTTKAYGRELLKVRRRTTREKGQVLNPEDTWLRIDAPALRIIDPDVAQRVDARRLDRRTRYLASVEKGGRVPERAHGKYLLSGGMLVCPQCGGHFEARIAPWKGQAKVYICSTRRRKPGVCMNTLALPIRETDDDVLGIVEGEVLGTRFIGELLALVDDGQQNGAEHQEADRIRLQQEISNLMDLAASGVPAETVAPKIRERQTTLRQLDAQLRDPRQPKPDIEKLRAALEQRATQWKADLRAEPRVARLVLRRLVGPLTLWEEAGAGVRWDAPPRPEGLLDGLVQLVASPAGFEPAF